MEKFETSGSKFYVVCDGVIVNPGKPFSSVGEAKDFISASRERDKMSLMLSKRLLRKILKGRVSPDLHDYNIMVEVVV